MTTIYVNYQLGVVMTDTRTTTTYGEYLFGIFKVGSFEEYNDNGTKAINVHDRIFVESGSCSESAKILQYFIDGTPIKPAHKKHKQISSCLLIDKNWILHISITNGVLKKKFYTPSKTTWYSLGSGADALTEALRVYEFQPTVEQALSAFEIVKQQDSNTGGSTRIYPI